ncbi:MAG TPA: hypothetical protein PKZ61_09440, partial [Thermoflexales bacterium]|nr:hypothetical protein [Thermoflexales bacterium]
RCPYGKLRAGSGLIWGRAVGAGCSENMIEPATSRRYFRNEGILMRAIVDDIRTRAPEICARLKLV